MNAVVEAAVAPAPRASLVQAMAARFGVEPEKMLTTLKSTAFKQQGDTVVSNEQMMALLVVANEYGLNPFTREIYAFPDRQGIVPVVSVDGWIRIINQHPQLRAIEFAYGGESGKHGGKPVSEWIECSITRGDRDKPVVVREFFSEVMRNTQPWNSHPNRMHRHKALIQAGRVAFGFSGIYDEDEAERIREARTITLPTAPAAIATINEQIAPQPAPKDAEPALDGELTGPVTYAHIAQWINDAQTNDAVDAALDIAAELPAQQIKELQVIAAQRKGQLEKIAGKPAK